jgi:hypothetical protein
VNVVWLLSATLLACVFIFVKMGVDLFTYRLRIGIFAGVTCQKAVGGVKVICSGRCPFKVLTVLCFVVCLTHLLLLAGDIEVNPGPGPAAAADDTSLVRKRRLCQSKACAVPSCTNNRRQQPRLSYFRFPTHRFGSMPAC